MRLLLCDRIRVDPQRQSFNSNHFGLRSFSDGGRSGITGGPGQAEAKALGGNAVIGVDLDFESIQMGKGGGMLMVTASGTAVVLEGS
jgi:hypothetical protein